ncbi:ATP-dependent DNA ligase [Sphingomonas sp. So64.6b]|nr:ATP-dependent DNA ligase [Sphingomonas sp. So64.6b]
MEAKLVAQLPGGPGWQYEPKWDGFRAIVVRDGEEVALWSKSGKPLQRYFPELVAAFAACRTSRFIIDGEIILSIGNVLSFDALQARLHPAPSRIARLSRETPAQFMAFDLLGQGQRDLLALPLDRRRAALETFHRAIDTDMLRLSPASCDIVRARAWLATAGGALDGVIAKPLDQPYRPGERAMFKVKQLRTADCVVGGFRRTADGTGIASLLLGLYDTAGELNHVGFVSGLAAADRPRLLDKLEPLVEQPGFTGKAPGGPSRWNQGKSAEWCPLRAECVVEVIYDQVTGDRFRHATRLHRWRPDKRPDQCTRDQLERELCPSELDAILP